MLKNTLKKMFMILHLYFGLKMCSIYFLLDTLPLPPFQPIILYFLNAYICAISIVTIARANAIFNAVSPSPI